MCKSTSIRLFFADGSGCFGFCSGFSFEKIASFIADGEIFVYDKSGKQVKRIQLEERPISLAIGGKDFNILFATTTKSLYSINL